MNVEEFNKNLFNYMINQNGSWIALHDAHNTSLSKTIEENGLCVSYSPYGKKVRRLKDEKGNIDLSQDFMATMYNLKNEDISNSPVSVVPVCPIIVNIPKELAQIAHIRPGELDAHKVFCGYGFEEFPESGSGRGKMTYQDTPDGANIRMLPSYLIAGHFDTETGNFVENPKHYSKLTPEAQEKIAEIVKSQYNAYQEMLANQNQPQ